MKKNILLFISILFFSCSSKKIITNNKEIIYDSKSKTDLELLLKSRFSDEKTRNDVYFDLIETFYTEIPNNIDSTLVLNKNN